MIEPVMLQSDRDNRKSYCVCCIIVPSLTYLRVQIGATSFRDDFNTIIGNQDSVFKLGSHTTILGDDSPIVVPFKAVSSTLGQHGFNGEDHAWLKCQSIIVSVVLYHRLDRMCENEKLD